MSAFLTILHKSDPSCWRTSSLIAFLVPGWFVFIGNVLRAWVGSSGRASIQGCCLIQSAAFKARRQRQADQDIIAGEVAETPKSGAVILEYLCIPISLRAIRDWYGGDVFNQIAQCFRAEASDTTESAWIFALRELHDGCVPELTTNRLRRLQLLSRFSG